MKKKDQDLLLLAALAWFLFFRKKPQQLDVGPVTVTPSPRTPHPLEPPKTTATDQQGNPVPLGRPGQTADSGTFNFDDFPDEQPAEFAPTVVPPEEN